MTRLIVAADAEADLDEILAYLRREASARVAEQYGRKFGDSIHRLVESPALDRRVLHLARMRVCGSYGLTF